MDRRKYDVLRNIDTLSLYQRPNQSPIPIAPARDFHDQLRLSLTWMDGCDASGYRPEMLKGQAKGKPQSLLVILTNTFQLISQLIEKTPEAGSLRGGFAFEYWFHSFSISEFSPPMLARPNRSIG